MPTTCTTIPAPTALITSLTLKLHELKRQLKDTHKAFQKEFKSSVMISAYKRSKAIIRGLKQNPSLLWRTVNNKPRTPVICTPESLAAYYTKLFDGSKVDEDRLKISPDDYPVPADPTRNTTPSYRTFDNLMSYVTHDELICAAKKMKRHKSPGPDLIPMECFTKAIIPKPPPANPAYPNQQSPPDYPVLDALSDIFNQCIESHVIPTAWKHVRISSVFKKGDPYDPANYRPISLSATSYRLFTSLMNSRLTGALEAHHILHDTIGAYRPQRSTTQNIALLTSYIHNAKRDNQPCFVAFVDLRKAFDSVSHTGMIRALHCASLPSDFVSLVKSIYTDLTASTQPPDSLPNHIKIKSGIRQGCPLSATIFNVYLSYIARKLALRTPDPIPKSPRENALFYADDITLVANSHKDMQILFYKLRELCADLQLNIDFNKTHFLACNCEKSERNKPFFYEAVAKHPCQSTKYLGVTITNTGDVTALLDDRIKKANSNATILAKVIKSHGLLHVKHVAQIVQAKVLQPLLFACEVWAPYILDAPAGKDANGCINPYTPNIKRLNELESVITSCLSTIYRLPSGTSKLALLLESGIPPIMPIIAHRFSKFIEPMSTRVDSPGTPIMFNSFFENPVIHNHWSHFIAHTLNAQTPCDSDYPSPSQILDLSQKWHRDKIITKHSTDSITAPTANTRIISTYIQQIWHGKIGQHHPIFDLTNISFATYMNCIRFRTMNIPAPVYNLPRSQKRTLYAERLCTYGCNAPADIFHIILHCPHTATHTQTKLCPPPALPIDIFNSKYDMHTTATIISTIMNMLQKKPVDADPITPKP